MIVKEYALDLYPSLGIPARRDKVVLEKGAAFKVMGQSKIFTFICHSRNSVTGREWVEGFDSVGRQRCFHPDLVVSVKTVTKPRKK